jgi:hypothetical protein
MSKVTITAPNPAFDGTSAGVKFSEGKAVIEVPRQQAALEYFARHRFGISEDVPAPKGADPLLAVGKTGDPSGVEQKGKKAAKAEPTPADPVKGAGDGPVGPQHNKGKDGADAGNTGTPTTPVDATI